MTRRTIPHRPDLLTLEQRSLYDEITAGPRGAESAFALVDEAGALTGPFDAMLLEPGIGRSLQALGTALRFHGSLTDRAREMAILQVGHHHDSGFEVYAHEAVARRIGLDESDLSALEAGRVPPGADAYETAVVTAVARLLERGDLNDADYQRAVELLGEPGVFEIVALVGYYALLATQLRVFRVPPSVAGR